MEGTYVVYISFDNLKYGIHLYLAHLDTFFVYVFFFLVQLKQSDWMETICKYNILTLSLTGPSTHDYENHVARV